MFAASALTTTRNTSHATSEVVDRVRSAFESRPGDLGFVFSSQHHADQLDVIGKAVIASGVAKHVIGCSGESIVGDGREVEGECALSLWCISLPNTQIVPVRFDRGSGGFLGWDHEWDRPAPDDRTLLLLGDPFRFPIDEWLKYVAATNPGLKVCGGMASGASVPGQIRLMLDGTSYDNGAVGLLVNGPAKINAIVSQGCRPVGRHLLVTKAERNIIHEVGRRPTVEVLHEIYSELDPSDQAKVQDGLHLGVVINEYQEAFGRGDFLVRNVMGPYEGGGITITDLIRVGQTVQFHVRDEETADEDLNELLAKHRSGHNPVGALVFTCNGRGSRLFSEPDHDVAAIRQAFGPIPTAGFFAMGEIGPVGGRNFVHGYTASVVLFEES